MKELIEKIKTQLDLLPDGFDLGDIGNIVGIEVAKFSAETPDLMYKDIGEFEWGFAHGVSLVNGTH